MKIDAKNRISKVIGIYFLSLGVFSILYSALVRKNPDQILWLCYIALVLFGFGILAKNKNLTVSQLSIQFFPLIVWNTDFFYEMITNKPLWGMTSYFFTPYHPLIAKFITLQHIYTIPLSLFAIYLIRTKERFNYKKIFLISFIQMLAVFILGKLFTDPEKNMNCVFHACIPLISPIPYELLWFAVVFVIIVLSTIIFTSLPFLRKK
ncbi:MAG: hypothetical protein AABY22_15420 [Nanoarchaeota archaeon]